MEKMYYEVVRIDGDYAHLQRLDENGANVDEDLKLVARALLPDRIEEGSRLVYEWLSYSIAE